MPLKVIALDLGHRVRHQRSRQPVVVDAVLHVEVRGIDPGRDQDGAAVSDLLHPEQNAAEGREPLLGVELVHVAGSMVDVVGDVAAHPLQVGIDPGSEQVPNRAFPEQVERVADQLVDPQLRDLVVAHVHHDDADPLHAGLEDAGCFRLYLRAAVQELVEAVLLVDEAPDEELAVLVRPHHEGRGAQVGRLGDLHHVGDGEGDRLAERDVAPAIPDGVAGGLGVGLCRVQVDHVEDDRLRFLGPEAGVVHGLHQGDYDLLVGDCGPAFPQFRADALCEVSWRLVLHGRYPAPDHLLLP